MSSRRMRTNIGFITLVCLGTFYVASSLLAATREYQIKAAFVHKFILFADFPNETMSRSDSSFTVCIYENNPFQSAFQSVEGSDVKGSILRVRHLTKRAMPVDMYECQVIYFCKTNNEQKVAQALRQLRQMPILTIGEHSSFLQSGGIIRIFSKHNKVVFSVNTHAAQESGIRFRSQMLRVAEQVIESEGRGQ